MTGEKRVKQIQGQRGELDERLHAVTTAVEKIKEMRRRELARLLRVSFRIDRATRRIIDEEDS